MQDPSTFQPIKPHFPEQEHLKCPRCDSTNTKFCYYNNYNLSQPRHFCKNCRRYWTKGGALRNIPVGGGSRKNTKRSSNPKRSNSGSDTDPTRVHGPAANQPRRMPEPSSSATTSSSQSVSNSAIRHSGSDHDPTRIYGLTDDQDRKMLDIPGSFSSLLASNGQYGGLLDGLNSNGSDFKMVQMGEFGGDSLNAGPAYNSGTGRDPGLEMQGGVNGNESYLSMQSGGDSSCWGGGGGGGGNGWPDLAIYTPGSNFQ